MNPPNPTPYRNAFVALAGFALLYAWFCLAAISRQDAWYRNTDMNVHNLVDALAINSNVSPVGVDQPAFPTKYLLALDFRIRHQLGLLTVANFQQLSASAEPVEEIRQLVHVERIHSRILVLILIMAAAGWVRAITGRIEPACLAVVLLAGCSGLLYHGLLSRPDLLCVGFGVIMAVQCAWRATNAESAVVRSRWLFLAGIGCGLSILSKLPGLLYLPACYAWCWLAALTREPASADTTPTLRRPSLVLLGVSLATLALLAHLGATADVPLTSTASLRLRVAATAVALLPFLLPHRASRRWREFVFSGGHEFALLLGGTLAALLLGYGLVRGVMTAPVADTYFRRILELIAAPDPLMKYFVSATPNIRAEFLGYVKEAPFLFLGAIAAAVGLWFLRTAPQRLRAFCLLLMATGAGVTLILSRRYYLDQFSIYAQLPLLLPWPLILFALGLWRAPADRAAGAPWAIPVVLSAATVMLVTAYWRVAPKYGSYAPSADLPVNPLSITFLFDHNAHPAPYLELMRSRYGDRDNFAAELERYLSNPDSRN